METTLYCSFLNQELFDDDRVTPDYFALNYDTYFHLFGLNAQVSTTKDAQGNDSIGYHYEPIVEDLEDDYGKLGPSVFGVDLDTTEKKRQAIENAIGDILPVRMQMNCLTSVPTQEVVHFMGMENMMYAMYDYPDLYKKMMDRIADDTLAYYHMLEEKRLILPTTAFEGVSQGSWAFNRELPGWDEWEKRPFTTKDVWGLHGLPGERGHLPRHVRGVHLPLLRENIPELRPLLLRLLRAGGPHLGQLHQQASQFAEGFHLSLVQRGVHG